MSELWRGLLFGALLSIPIGVAVNLISGPIGRAISNRSQDSADKRASKDAQFAEEAKDYAENRQGLYMYLLDTLIRIAYITSLFGILSGFLWFAGQAIDTPYNLIEDVEWRELSPTIVSGVYAIANLAALIGTMIVLNIARPAVQMVREVRRLARATPSSPSASHI